MEFTVSVGTVIGINLWMVMFGASSRSRTSLATSLVLALDAFVDLQMRFLLVVVHWIIENKLFSSGIPKDGQRSNFGLRGTSVVSQPLRHEWHLWSSCSSWYFDILGGSRSLLAYLKRETVQTIVTIINVIAPRVCADFRSVETSWTVFFLLRPCGQHPKKRFPLTDIWSHHAHELLAAQKAPQWFSFGILQSLQTAGLTDWRDPSLLSVLRNLLLGQG